MTDVEAARNFGVRPGQPLHDSIELPGWEHRSIWGYDDVGSFYAQLWRNDSTADAPDTWLSGVEPIYSWPGCIALAVVETTGHDPVTVIRALGLANPDPGRPYPRRDRPGDRATVPVQRRPVHRRQTRRAHLGCRRRAAGARLLAPLGCAAIHARAGDGRALHRGCIAPILGIEPGSVGRTRPGLLHIG